MGLPAALLDAGYAALVRPVLFRSYGGDPEAIHERLISLLAGPGSAPPLRGLTRLLAGSSGRPARVAGIDFPSRVGVAAGLDKDASAVLAWRGLGFGFAELGTVTAQGQPGNERPRVFRLRESRALINRMGFNNPGAAAVAATLAARGVWRRNGAAGLPVGLSIGKTKAVDLQHAVEDYLTSLRLLAPHADYVAVNVSSPNTPGLRSLQDAGALAELLTALVAEARHLVFPEPMFPEPVEGSPPGASTSSASNSGSMFPELVEGASTGSANNRGASTGSASSSGASTGSASRSASMFPELVEGASTSSANISGASTGSANSRGASTGSASRSATTPLPIFVKVAPDLSWAQLDEVLTTCADAGASGLIATNTTLSRDGLAPADQPRAREPGGLSGAPLTVRAREVVAYVAAHTDLPVIGSGGIMTAVDASALFDAGADLVQLYTGFIYGGPGLPAAINASDGERQGS
jgi:dihydroorotate dehydrogenase